jgi:hypothetical protein
MKMSVLLLVVVLLFSCTKHKKVENELDDGLTGLMNDIFYYTYDQEKYNFYNISETDDYYVGNDNFNYMEYFPEDRFGNIPGKYIIVKNDEIEMEFYPAYYRFRYDDEVDKYKLQFIRIIAKTNNYFLGKFIGKKIEELEKIFPNYEGKSQYKSNEIVILNYGKTIEREINTGSKLIQIEEDLFINFYLKDNIITKIHFGYVP